MEFVSIIIPTFNRSASLKRALKSIYQQSYSNYEVIVIDDGSSDETALMLQHHFPQIKYFYHSNSGVSATRNKGLELSSGSWIAFLDSDDEWLPDKLQRQMEVLTSMPEYKVCHTEEIWIRNGVRVNQMNKHKKTGGWIFPQCLPLCAMSPSSIVIHRSVFEEIGTFDPTLPACEDYDLWLRITAKYPVLYLEQPQIKKHGGHEDQLSRQYWGMDRFRIKALQNILNSDCLTSSNRQKATQMLLKKVKIFQQGALKRGKNKDVQYYQLILDEYS